MLRRDPGSATEFSDILYNNDELTVAISKALDKDGILVSQVGESEDFVDPPSEYTRESTLVTSFIPNLKRHGFEKAHSYEDMHGGFMAAWTYFIAFKDTSSSRNWYASQAEIDLKMRERILPTLSGESPLRYFDGATMKAFSYPSRLSERDFCLDNKKRLCRIAKGFEPMRDVDKFAGEARDESLEKESEQHSQIQESVKGLILAPEAAQRLIRAMRSGASGAAEKSKLVESFFLDSDAQFAHNSDNLLFLTNADCEAVAMNQEPGAPSKKGGDVYNPLFDRNSLVLRHYGAACTSRARNRVVVDGQPVAK